MGKSRRENHDKSTNQDPQPCRKCKRLALLDRYAPDPVPIHISDIYDAFAVHPDPIGIREFSGSSGTVPECRRTVAGQCRDYSCGTDLADTIVALVGHIYISRAIYRNPRRVIELGGRSGRVYIAFCASGQCRDHACRADLTDTLVKFISHIYIAASIYGDPGWLIKFSARSCPFHISGSAIARQGRDYPCRADLPDAAIHVIGHIYVSTAVNGHSVRRIKLSGCTWTFLVSEYAASRERCDHCRRIDLTDYMIVRIGNIYIATLIHRHSHWRIKFGGSTCRIFITGHTSGQCVYLPQTDHSHTKIRLICYINCTIDAYCDSGRVIKPGRGVRSIQRAGQIATSECIYIDLPVIGK